MKNKAPINLPPQLQSDPFWTNSLLPPRTTFGSASKEANPPKKDLRYNIANEVNQWSPIDKYGRHNSRIHVESSWGKYSSPPGVGEYDPNHEKKSQAERFIAYPFPSKPYDAFFDELEYKKQHPRERVIEHLPDVFAKKQPYTAKAMPGEDESDLKNVSVEDMKKALLPGPGAYGGDYHKIEKFPLPARPRLKPRSPIANPRLVIDKQTLEIVNMEERRQMFKGSYFSYDDPTKKHHPVFSFGQRRELFGQAEDSSPGPGAYTIDPVNHLGSPSALSSTDKLYVRPITREKAVRREANLPRTKSFGRKSLIG
eukprot:gene11296-12601_t